MATRHSRRRIVALASRLAAAFAAVARFWSDLIFADDLERGSTGAWTASVP